MISLIVAMDENRAIGKTNDLPWYLPADLKHFKQLTNNHTVIMGRKTYDSIFTRLNGPLPNRENIIITRDSSYTAPGARVVNTPQEAIDVKTDDAEVFVIGGAQIYEQFLPMADKLYVTEVHTKIDGADTFFPIIDTSVWHEASREDHKADERNGYDYSFVTYERL